MRLSPPTFTDSKVVEDTQGLDDLEKIFRVVHATDVEGVEFVAYQLKDVVYKWYEEWEHLRGDYVESRFFSQELKEVKAEEFMNLNQGRMIVKEYALKFHQLSCYASELMSSMRARMWKFSFGLSHDLVL